jgi:hypothetical protein
MDSNDVVTVFCSLSYKYFKLNGKYKWHRIQTINYQNKPMSVGLMNSIRYKYEVKLINVDYYKVRSRVLKWTIEYYWFKI